MLATKPHDHCVSPRRETFMLDRFGYRLSVIGALARRYSRGPSGGYLTMPVKNDIPVRVDMIWRPQ